ncbi:DNA polymerase beta superfamily protein [Nocardia sp. alder85J]|uniref:nucleotidyltransferase domain-containing protein n=1 Tax=Nocardia sp. alder85J TaxID=2862949 RepID=UPI001CD31F5E|nr:nucleotidyltransferase domain-containing protein [Nocardia sp. alder85J]MCX4091889.1 nucleotidyltransferase domain-containing protein [Nocardia sp. alder85J]
MNTTTTHLLLEGVVGSTAYGLSTPTSDLDYAGVYVEPTANLLGLHPPDRQRSTRTGRDGADATYHELGKAMGLILACNPSAMEVLWLEEYLCLTDFGAELVALREHFLSASRVRKAFYGYATAQVVRLARHPRTGDPRRAKHARHTMRLLWQGHQLYTTGVLPVRVTDPDAYFAFGEQVMADPDAVVAQELLAQCESRFDDSATVLPAAPNEAPLEDFLQRVRRAHLTAP